MITVMDAHKSLNHVDDHCLDFQNVTIPSGMKNDLGKITQAKNLHYTVWCLLLVIVPI